MTREEAINNNKNLRMYMRLSDKNQPYKFLEKNYIALDMAIKALEQEPSNDMVSHEVFDEYGNYKYPSDFELTEPNTATSMPCGDAISRQAVISTIYDNKSDFKNNFAQGFFADKIRALAPQEPKTGHWIFKKDCKGKIRKCCDKCGYEIGKYTWKNPNYCPNCGAKMIEPQESEG